MFCRMLTFAVFIFFHVSSAYAENEFRIALLLDGPVSQEMMLKDYVENEVEKLLGRDRKIEFSQVNDGGWTKDGVSRVLDELLEQNDIDAIITMGMIGSSLSAKHMDLKKPVISVMIGDSEVQNFPLKNGRSGKKNFVYVKDSLTIRREINKFHEVAGFKSLVVIADSAWVNGFPEIGSLIEDVVKPLSANVQFISVTNKASEVVKKIKSDADAVYVTPLLRFNHDEIGKLAELLVERNLKSFSSVGTTEVENGLMMAASANSDLTSLARRIAIILQRITLGKSPETIAVDFNRPERMIFNIATAKAVNFSPSWDDLQNSDLINLENDTGLVLSLNEAVDTSLANNRNLAVVRYSPSIAKQNVRLAKSPFLPQLTFSGGTNRIKERTADATGQAKESTDVGVAISQLVYSERAWADLYIAREFEQSAGHQVQREVLDTIETTSSAYFQLLQAHSLREVRRKNLSLTRENLKLAETRLRLGYSDRGDVLRWKSREASERSDLFDAQAGVEQGQTLLAQTVGQGFDTPVSPSTDGMDHVVEFFSSPEVQRYVNDPLNWRILQEFYRAEAVANSPELKALDNQISALERDRDSRKRAFYTPTVEIEGAYGKNTHRSGGPVGLDDRLGDDTWSVGVTATLPITTGGARRARLSRANIELEQAKAARAALVEEVETRVSLAAQRAGSTHPSIALAEEARKNAIANLRLVQDRYSKGAVGVTDLIDAQDAALEAQLQSAQIKFQFLTDMARLLRAAGDFSLLLDPAKESQWLNKINEFYSSYER